MLVVTVTVYSCKLINYLHPHIFGARLIESNRKQNLKEENKQEEGWRGWQCQDKLLCQSKKIKGAGVKELGSIESGRTELAAVMELKLPTALPGHVLLGRPHPHSPLLCLSISHGQIHIAILSLE